MLYVSPVPGQHIQVHLDHSLGGLFDDVYVFVFVQKIRFFS